MFKLSFTRTLGFVIFLIISSQTTSAQHFIKLSKFRHLKKFLSYSEDRQPLVSAHRGGIYPDLPENSLQAFSRSLEQVPAIIECDVAMTADSQLVLMHDDRLDRTTNGKGFISKQHSLDLKRLFLRNNNRQLSYYRIPTLEQTLKWARNKTILMLDIKGDIPPKKIVDMIKAQKARHYVVIISYNLSNAEAYHALDRRLFHSVSLSQPEQLSDYEQSRIPLSQMIFFVGVGRFNADLVEALHAHKRFCILGSMGNTDAQAQRFGASIYAAFFANGIDMISSDFPPLVYQAAKEHSPKDNPQKKYLKVIK